jgi:hypothetical protein
VVGLYKLKYKLESGESAWFQPWSPSISVSRFQRLLSNATCAATPRRLTFPNRALPGLKCAEVGLYKLNAVDP